MPGPAACSSYGCRWPVLPSRHGGRYTRGSRADPGRGGGLPQPRPGELFHPGPEADPGAETETAGRGGRGGHDVAHVAEPELAGDHGRRATERRGQRLSHLADRVRLAAGPVVRLQGARLPGVERAGIGPGHVVDVDEVALLAAILEDPGGAAALERGSEDRGDTGVGRVPRHSRPVDVVV